MRTERRAGRGRSRAARLRENEHVCTRSQEKGYQTMMEKVLDAWPVAVMFLVLMGAARPALLVLCRLMGWC